MAWYDGTDDYTLEELEKEYPVVVTPNLRTSEDRKRLAIINDYPEGAELYELSDPKVEKDHWGKHVFYQTFLGADAVAAKTAVEAFLSRAEEDGESILLLRKDILLLFYTLFLLKTDSSRKKNWQISGNSVLIYRGIRVKDACPVSKLQRVL